MTIEGLGKKFEEARLARNLTLDEASRMTKIRPSRLAEIEADDFSQFPSLAYAKGFLLIYGKFLEVDVTPYMEAFEGSDAVTVDGYSYLQDNPAPKPARTPVVPRRSPKISSPSGGGRPTSLMPLVYAIIIILVGYFATRLFLNIQRIAPHHPEPSPAPLASVAPVGTPPSIIAPSATAAAAPTTRATATAPPATPRVTATAPPSTPRASATAPPATPPPPTAAPATTVRPASPPPSAPPKSTAAPSATAPAKTTPAPSVPAASPGATPVAKPSGSPAPAGAAAEPEVRRAEPVKPEDLTKAAPAAAPGANKISIRPLKKTYIKVVVDDESSTPAFERWISPNDGAVEFKGQHFSVRVLDRDSVQIKKNGKSVAEGDTDVTIE